MQAGRGTPNFPAADALKVIGAVLFAFAGLVLLIATIVYLSNYPANRAAEYRAVASHRDYGAHG